MKFPKWILALNVCVCVSCSAILCRPWMVIFLQRKHLVDLIHVHCKMYYQKWNRLRACISFRNYFCPHLNSIFVTLLVRKCVVLCDPHTRFDENVSPPLAFKLLITELNFACVPNLVSRERASHFQGEQKCWKVNKLIRHCANAGLNSNPSIA